MTTASIEVAHTPSALRREGISTVGETMLAYGPVLAANQVRASRRGLPQSPVSPAEVTLLEAFNELELKPQLQAEVGPYDADFLFEEEQLCVEVDGRQHLAARVADRTRDEYFRRRDIRTLRLSASEVRRDPFACAERVLEELKSRPATTPPIANETHDPAGADDELATLADVIAETHRYWPTRTDEPNRRGPKHPRKSEDEPLSRPITRPQLRMLIENLHGLLSHRAAVGDRDIVRAAVRYWLQREP